MLAIIARITIYFTLLGTAFFTVGPKRAQMAPQWSAERTADYQTPVNILSKYDNLVEKNLCILFVPGQKISQQMLESPLSSPNKQLNWADLLIIYRIESQGATAFVDDTDSICRWQKGFVFRASRSNKSNFIFLFLCLKNTRNVCVRVLNKQPR